MVRRLEDYASVVGEDLVNDIYSEAKQLAGKKLVHINSAPVGGGVAEILNSIVPLFKSIGINTKWEILEAPKKFFVITKKIHNMLQGEKGFLSEKEKKLYLKWNKINASMINLDKPDFVVIHDPQPLPLINFYEKNKKNKSQHWLWRCHIDITRPNRGVLYYTRQFIKNYNLMIVSMQRYKKGFIREEIITPSIDPLSKKNKYLSDAEVSKILSRHDISRDKPIVAQISRFDKWKDPLGVIEAFKLVKQKFNCRLVLLGNMADDDPESLTIYERIVQKSAEEKDIVVKSVAGKYENDMLVNALGRATSVIIQKSLREGFALTVTEASWKGTPIVGSKVGGIPLQVVNGKNGFLVSNIKECAQKTLWLLKNRTRAEKMGEYGKERVGKNFLVTRHLLDYVRLLKKYAKIAK